MLKSDFMACNDSMVNRETCFRDAIDQRMEVLKAAMNRSLSHLEAEMVNCFKRRDEHWKNEMARIKTTSTPVSPYPLRVFANDYRALCLRWKDDLPEEEVVRRILNSCNPSLASSLRGAVHTVEQLVKVGSLVERDLNSKKDYWARVNQLKGTNEGEKSASSRRDQLPKSPSTSVQHISLIQTTTPPLLKVAIGVGSYHVEAIVDTGFDLFRNAETVMGGCEKNRRTTAAGFKQDIHGGRWKGSCVRW